MNHFQLQILSFDVSKSTENICSKIIVIKFHSQNLVLTNFRKMYDC